MTDPAPSDRREPTALLLKWADMAVRSRLEAAVRPWRLSMGQMLLLATLERKRAASPADLARSLHLTPQAMTTLLRPLEERGVITRRTDPEHARRLSFSLSDEGQRLLAEIRATTDAVDREVTAALTPAELDQLRGLLARIAATSGG